jgi:hypothetical protein
MSTITTIQDSDLISSSNEVINDNFTNLNTDKIETSYLDTDTTLAANSDTKIATQKAVKAYVDAGGNQNASETTRGIVQEATDLQVTNATATGSTGAKLFVTPAKANTAYATKFATTEVFSGAAPQTFTDLDLSGVVGATQRMVMLKFIQQHTDSRRIAVRKNGDSDGNLGYSANTFGANSGGITGTSGHSTNLIIQTDTNGVIEWISSTNANIKINVEAYW